LAVFLMDFDVGMNLQSDDFELFGVPRCFAQDRSVLDSRWKDLQRQAHPDRHAAMGAAAQRVAMQWSVRINEAYARLKDPLARASYLCELHGAPIQANDNTAMPAAFLMQQMQWREDLEDATSAGALDALADEVLQSYKNTLAACERMLDADQDYQAASGQVRALMFIRKFQQDIAARQDQLAA
jgi:molecular chaperone HscB